MSTGTTNGETSTLTRNVTWQQYVELRDGDELHQAIDPPPDLAVEDNYVTARSIERLPIYTALGVPELWRWHEDKLDLLRLDPAGQYGEVPASRALPGFPCEIAH